MNITPGRTVCAIVGILISLGGGARLAAQTVASSATPAATVARDPVAFGSPPQSASVGAIIIAAAQSITDRPAETAGQTSTRSPAAVPSASAASAATSPAATMAGTNRAATAADRQPAAEPAAAKSEASSPFVEGGQVDCPYGNFYDTRNLRPMPPTRRQTESAGSNSILSLFGGRHYSGPKRTYSRSGR